MNLPLLLSALGILGLIYVLWRANRDRLARRSAYFDQAAGRFERVSRRIEPSGFPRMTAAY